MSTTKLAVAALSTMLTTSALGDPLPNPGDQGRVFNVAIFKVKSGHEGAFERIMQQVVIDSRNEPGNVEYRFHQSAGDPQVFMAYEVFRSDEDAKAHLNSEHIQRAVQDVKDLLDGAIVLQSYRMVK